jgi:hypothetical protein
MVLSYGSVYFPGKSGSSVENTDWYSSQHSTTLMVVVPAGSPSSLYML